MSDDWAMGENYGADEDYDIEGDWGVPVRPALDNYWTPTVEAVIVGDIDPYDLAMWDEESESYYFGNDWTMYDGLDLNHIYEEWLERHPKTD